MTVRDTKRDWILLWSSSAARKLIIIWEAIVSICRRYTIQKYRLYMKDLPSPKGVMPWRLLGKVGLFRCTCVRFLRYWQWKYSFIYLIKNLQKTLKRANLIFLYLFVSFLLVREHAGKIYGIEKSFSSLESLLCSCLKACHRPEKAKVVKAKKKLKLLHRYKNYNV